MSRFMPGSFKPETGDWVPEVQILPTNAGINHLQQDGWYERIGNLVYVQFAVRFDYAGGGVGGVFIKGFPYPIDGSVQVGAGIYDAAGGIITGAENVTLPANFAGWSLELKNDELIPREAFAIRFQSSTVAGGTNSMTATLLAAAGNGIAGSGWYRTP